MKPKAFQAALEALDLNYVQAAAFLGTNEKTVRRWAHKVSRIPRAIELLLNYMVAHNLMPDDVERASKQ